MALEIFTLFHIVKLQFFNRWVLFLLIFCKIFFNNRGVVVILRLRLLAAMSFYNGVIFIYYLFIGLKICIYRMYGYYRLKSVILFVLLPLGLERISFISRKWKFDRWRHFQINWLILVFVWKKNRLEKTTCHFANQSCRASMGKGGENWSIFL